VRAVRELNRALVERVELSICTVAVVHVVETETGTTATVVCAGHPRPLLVRGALVEAVPAAGPVVGAWADGDWTPQRVELAPGDMLVLYTDGVTDAYGADERFGEERLVATIRNAPDTAAVIDAIRSALHDFERGPQADDTAVVAVQRLPVRVSAGGGD
jgi:serine phosphatase RsbU (regulator of sigma subunit)